MKSIATKSIATGGGSPWLRPKSFGEQAISAFKAGLAAFLCLWLGNLLGLKHSYWAAISAIVVMGSNSAVTFTSCRDRMIGTGIGALLGWGTSYIWHGNGLVYGAFVAICVFVCGLLQFDKAGRLAAVALTIIVLVNPDASPGRAAIARFAEVALGIVVALAVTLLVFPAQPEQTEPEPAVQALPNDQT